MTINGMDLETAANEIEKKNDQIDRLRTWIFVLIISLVLVIFFAIMAILAIKNKQNDIHDRISPVQAERYNMQRELLNSKYDYLKSPSHDKEGW